MEDLKILHLSKLLSTGDYSDCTLTFPKEDGKILRVHANIISAASSVFESKIKEQSTEKTQSSKISKTEFIIAIEDVEYETFQEIIKFMYCQDLTLQAKSSNELFQLYRGFHFYQCDTAKTFFKKFVFSQIDNTKQPTSDEMASTFIQLFDFARKENDQELQEFCDEGINKHPGAIIKSNQLLELEFKEFNDIVLMIMKNRYVHFNLIFSMIDKYFKNNKKCMTEDNILALKTTLDSLQWQGIEPKLVANSDMLSLKQKIKYLKEHEVKKQTNHHGYGDPYKVQNTGSLYIPKMDEVKVWEKYENNMKMNFMNMFKNEAFTDCVFIFRGGEVKAHKLILSQNSPVFKAMSLNNENEVEIKDTNMDTFKTMLQMMYFQRVELSEMSSEDLADLYGVAHKYQFSEGLSVIRQYINTRGTDAIYFYEMAQLYDDKTIKGQCLLYFKYRESTIDSKRFFTATPETICLLYASKQMNKFKIIKLITALENYIKINEGKYENIENQLEPALKVLEFNNNY